MQKLSQEFYDRDTIVVAKALLGKLLVHKVNNQECIAKIVEVEAYLGPHDLAAHSAKGKTKRTEIMFGPPGHAYVYMIYGMYFCMNVVTEAAGRASAVLLRAVEPLQDITARTQGPGLLCKAMHINKKQNGLDLTGENFYISAPAQNEKFTIIKRPRIGIAYAGIWAKKLLRFYIKGNAFISKP